MTIPTTDTREKGLESLIEAYLLEHQGYEKAGAYDPVYGVDRDALFGFLAATQPETVARLAQLLGAIWQERLLQTLTAQINKRGIVDVLRKGIREQTETVRLYFPAPATSLNPDAARLYAANRFAVGRQIYFSRANRQSVDMVLYLNGLPLVTIELKNHLTRQTVQDAMRQYRQRDPKELLFTFGKALVHFAVDEELVYMTTHLQGESTYFLPFNKGYRNGAGNPPNPNGLKTAYLWERIFSKPVFSAILEKYAQLVTVERKSKPEKRLIFPRYHQWDVVSRLLADLRQRGLPARYLIEHSAGSGKSNSIAWLAHQLVELHDSANKPFFDSVIVVTDRRVLDSQLRDTVKQFLHVPGVMAEVKESSAQLRDALNQGKRLITTTVQKFPFVVEEVRALGDRRFAILIDEAHSGQSGRNVAQMHAALGRDAVAADDDTREVESDEDLINRIIAEQRMLTNAAYFAFTATPKNKTLETFGAPDPATGKPRPFHLYSMRQAIEEEFILDVLRYYTPYERHVQIVKTIEEDPRVQSGRAAQRIKQYVSNHPEAIRRKARVIVDHFRNEVYRARKINGQAKAMVVTGGIEAAIRYYLEISRLLAQDGFQHPYKAIVAFTGSKTVDGESYTEDSLNGFPSNDIPDKFDLPEYRILIVAEKFQTGFDQPKLHTMYVDKKLADVQAVQTLSRLNRALKPYKNDVFILDFVNSAADIEAAFKPYYEETILSATTDLNRLNELQAELDAAQVYSAEQVREFMSLYINNAPREQLDPILDSCVEVFNDYLEREEKITFKQKARAFQRAYQFLVMVKVFSNPYWQSLATFLNFLLTKLPPIGDDDTTLNILNALDMERYDVTRLETRAINLVAEGEIAPMPVGGGGAEEEMVEFLSAIIDEFNRKFGYADNAAAERVKRIAFEELPRKIAADEEYQNAKQYSDRNNARITFKDVFRNKLQELITEDTDFYRRVTTESDIRDWLIDRLFTLDYDSPDAA